MKSTAIKNNIIKIKNKFPLENILSIPALKSGDSVFSHAAIIWLAAIAVLVFIISATMGRYEISLQLLADVFKNRIIGAESYWDNTVDTVLFDIRLPRIVAAMFVGGSMAISGAVYQGLFKNPMVSPDILGASAGSGFGAAIAILLSFGTVGIQVSSFIFGLSAVAITFMFSRIISKGNNTTLALVLIGMVIATLFN